MNEKALGYLVMFSVFAIFGKMAYRWYLDEVYASAGKDNGKVIIYKQERLKFKTPFKLVFQWLIEESPNPELTKKKIIIYELFRVPLVLLAVFAFIGLFTHELDDFLDVCPAIMILYLLGTAFMCLTRGKKS